MPKKFLIVKVLLFVLSQSFLFAQFSIDNSSGYLFKKEFNLGLHLSTNGTQLNFVSGFKQSASYYHQFGVGIGNIKHEKEYSSKNELSGDSKRFVYGKINTPYAARFHFGGRLVIFESTRNQGVEVNFVWALGFSFAYLKPVYLQIKEPFNFQDSSDPKDERYDPTIHFQENIYGKSSFFKGINEGYWQGGFFAKSGVFLDFSQNKSMIAGIEFGAKMDVFLKTIVILYETKNHAIFPAFYLGLNIGKKKL